MKTISIFLALVNSLFAGLLILFSLSSVEIQQAASLWVLTKLLAAGSVIGIGVITWIGSVGYVKQGLMALASLYLVALGAATAVWTVHLAQTTGDMEFYMLMFAGSLFFQGTALLFGISNGEGNTFVA
jgi:hypothetical protein